METVAVVDAYMGGRGAVWQRLEDEVELWVQALRPENQTGSGVATQPPVKLEARRPSGDEQRLEDERGLRGRAPRLAKRRRSGRRGWAPCLMGQGLSGQGLRGLEGQSQRESGVAIESVAAVGVGVGGRAGVGQVKGELGLWG